MNTNQSPENPNKLDPTTETFSLMELLMLESEEQKQPPDYPVLWNELMALCEEFFKDPSIRMTRKFLRLIVLMRFFGVYPESKWKENQWRLEKVPMNEEYRSNLLSPTDGYLFWKPPAKTDNEVNP